MRALLAAVAAVAALPGIARADCPTDFEFVLIADDTGDLALSNGASVRSLPSINTDGKVAFNAFLDAGGRAILSGDENELVVKLEDRQADIDSDWESFGDPLISDSGAVHLFGRLDDGSEPQPFNAIARITTTNAVQTLAAAIPNGQFIALSSDIDVGSSSGVAFVGTPPQSQSILSAVHQGTPSVVDDNEPNGYSNISYASDSAFAYHTVAGLGVQLKNATGSMIAETDPQTGLGPTGTPSQGPGGAIAYVFAYPDPADPARSAFQIRRYSPDTGTSTTVADSAAGDFGRHAAGTDVASLLDQSQLGGTGNRGWGGCVVFLGSGNDGRDTVYIADEDGINIVIQEGDELLGAPAATLEMRSQGLNARGQIALWAQTTDFRQMIVRVDPTELGSGDDPVDPDDPGTPDDDIDEGCACSGGGDRSSTLGLLLLLLLATLTIGRSAGSGRRSRSSSRRSLP